MRLSRIDKKLIVLLQEEFPLVLRPFKELAGRLSITEDEVLKRVRHLKACGIIKRIGPVHDSQRLGFKRTLMGMSVPKDTLEKVVEIVNSFKEVTHNYLREDPEFNLWFTLICPTQKRISEIISTIKQKSGIKDIINLPTIKMIKIKTIFKPR